MNTTKPDSNKDEVRSNAAEGPRPPQLSPNSQKSASARAVEQDSSHGPLSSESLALSVKTLINLAVEFERIQLAATSGNADVDAALYEELFDLEGTEAALRRVHEILADQRQRRQLMVKTARVVRFAHELCERFPSKKALPKDAAEVISDLAESFGVDSAASKIAQIVEAVRRQEGANQGRVTRIYELLVGKEKGARTIRDMAKLLDSSSKQNNAEVAAKAKRKTSSGKVKYTEQLDVAWYEGETVSDCLRYVMQVIGADVPYVVEPVMSALTAALAERMATARKERAELKETGKSK